MMSGVGLATVAGPARFIRRPAPWLARNLLGTGSPRHPDRTGDRTVHARRRRPGCTIRPLRASRGHEPPRRHPHRRHQSCYRRLHDSLQRPVPAGYRPCGDTVAMFVLMFLLGIAGMGIPPVGTGLAVRLPTRRPRSQQQFRCLRSKEEQRSGPGSAHQHSNRRWVFSGHWPS
jgi:hypothetical protein